MAKTKNQNETPARRGRPASFPDQDTVALLARIPAETRNMLREVAEKREEPLNVALDRAIRRVHREAMRSRSRSKAASASE